ncbi:DNA-formamidopyrimidine glycosylase family protein [Nonomuraea longicatena]|uniref:DNA-(apurinic or apyrimidinic site) lyase n=1 Tax=Nonomuraea longicatena TaxID=83682 RepID=A0ABN1PIG4_9ACTN
MPEGDAVYRTAARLREALDGRVLTRTDFRVPRHATSDLSGRTVLTTVSYGKHLLTRVAGGPIVHTHLRMDGSWRILPSGRRPPPGDQVRLILANAEWQAVGLKLGAVDLVSDESEVIGHLGPDLLSEEWEAAGAAAEAVRRLRERPERTIGEALLDQRALAGLGTVYRAETLFLRGLWPWRRVGEIEELEDLVTLARRLLRANLRYAGTVTTGDRRPGSQTWVYGRAGRPCRRCGRRISRGEMGAHAQERLILWCENCQPR